MEHYCNLREQKGHGQTAKTGELGMSSAMGRQAKSKKRRRMKIEMITLMMRVNKQNVICLWLLNRYIY